MAQYLRALAAFPQDPTSIPHGGLQPSVIPIPEDLTPFSGFLWAPDMYVVHRHICKQNNPRYKIKINIFSKEDLVLCHSTFTKNSLWFLVPRAFSVRYSHGKTSHISRVDFYI